MVAGIVAVAAIAGAIAVRGLTSREALQSVSPASISVVEALSTAASAIASGLAAEPSSTPSAPEIPPPARCPAEPMIDLRAPDPRPTSELMRLAKEDPRSLGSASIGSPTRGGLWGGVEMKGSEGIVRAGAYGWGTESVILSIERAVREVRRCHPDSPKLYVGDIARERGGWLRPHRSHQSGLDADIGYFYKTGSVWYQRATAENLDLPRTWTLIRALIEGGNVEMIFMDISIQRLFQSYFETLPETERPQADLFESPLRKDALIRHTWGHASHFHVRFTDPAAVKLGQRIGRELQRIPKPRPPKPAPRRIKPRAR
ncbi:MAG: penicillin-insensitive murein endopeptidase [Polyangiaceae bacterium]|nr:penicillin-insensitive murein endopeptidase [Polyangiaceae bacterium]